MDHQVCLIFVQLRYLAQRELTLQKKRLAVEETIRKHKELLKKDRELDKEEASVNKLVDKAMEMLRQTPLSSTRHGHSLHREPSPSTAHYSIQTPLSSTRHGHSLHREPSPSTAHYSMSERLSVGSMTEELSGTESIVEEMSRSSIHDPSATEIPSVYATDTFEPLESTLTASHPPHPVTTSTPSHQAHSYTQERQSEMDDKVAESTTGENVTMINTCARFLSTVLRTFNCAVCKLTLCTRELKTLNAMFYLICSY